MEFMAHPPPPLSVTLEAILEAFSKWNATLKLSTWPLHANLPLGNILRNYKSFILALGCYGKEKVKTSGIAFGFNILISF